MSNSTRPSPVAAADLSEYLRSKDDFAFEREIYHIAHGLRLQPEHAGLYEDPVTNKPRQFDIRCHAVHGAERIDLAIECKSLSPTYPLLASCVPRARNEAYHEILYTDSVPGNRGSYTQVRKVSGGCRISSLRTARFPQLRTT